MSVINRLNSSDQGFDEQLTQLLAYDEAQDSQIESAVSEILTNVRERGDAAVVEYSRKFDGVSAEHMAELEVSKEACEAALAALPLEQRDALTQAAKRIRAYHERQKSTGWTYEEEDGTVLGVKVTPMDRVGLYVPGGKAAYPSSVLMNAIPAKVAGVGEVV